MFVHGNLKESQEEAGRQYKRFQHSSPIWALKFRGLEAEAALWRGMFDEALKLLDPPLEVPSQPDMAIPILAVRGVANAHLHRYDEAGRSLDEADRLCSVSSSAACGDVVRARGVLAIERRQLKDARGYFEDSLSFARLHVDRFLEASALLNLGDTSIFEEHFDESVDRSEEAYQAATAIGAGDIAMVAAGNLGWAYYKLGDSDRALALFLDAEKRADELGDIVDRASWLTNAGYIYMDSRNFPLAREFFQRALDLDPESNSKENIYNALRVLARLSLQTGNLQKASEFAEQALDIARKSKNRLDELYPLLVQGQVVARRGDTAAAEHMFQEIEQDSDCPRSLKWEAQHSLARLYEDGAKTDAADREYRAALTTFEAARDQVRHEASQLSFLTNAAGIYDDYIHFLVVQGKTNEALRWADHNRARTLAEGLGLLLSKKASAEPPPLNAPAISRHEKSTLLFYWLGEKRSYLWAITPQKTSLFPLRAGVEIDAAVRGYREALGGPQDVLESANQDGLALYRTLIAPAQALLPKDGKVVIIPDGSLNNLNFETLLVNEPRRHYWIEDATISSAGSLRVLAASYAPARKPVRNLLLMGNSVAPNLKYPELPKAAIQVESVAGHFSPARRRVLTRDEATPAAYLDGKPEQFSHIHFVAHGTASRLSPLDSAIVLSKGGAQEDSFKLYARDIIRHPLRADLVTISACYGVGDRAYWGEGLVGLSWAFLRAGAHNVIAALWEATDVSTEQLMGRFYDELDKGATPDAALRTAKLSLLRGAGFHNPYYWAPFQLYAGSYRGREPAFER